MLKLYIDLTEINVKHLDPNQLLKL